MRGRAILRVAVSTLRRAETQKALTYWRGMLVVVSLIARLPSRIDAARHLFRVTTLIGDLVLSRPDLAAPRRAWLSVGRSLSTEVARFRLTSQMEFSAPTGWAQLPEGTAIKPHRRLRPSN